jgi:hypothetical protein
MEIAGSIRLNAIVDVSNVSRRPNCCLARQ